MNSTARKYPAPASDYAAPAKSARAKGKPVYRRYAVRLNGQPTHAAVMIDDAESHTDAAIAFAERAAFVGRSVSVVVTDCLSGASCSFVLDFEGGDGSSC
jgi:hypothetical protein